MPKLKYQKLLFGLTIIFIFLGIFFWFNHRAQQGVEIYFFNVGQGDACLIKTPGKNKILVDGGPDESILPLLAEHLPWLDRQIDLVISTHPDSDHLFGLNELIQRYHFSHILMTGVLSSAPIYAEWLEQIKLKKIPVKIIDHPQKIIVDNVVLDIFSPQKSFNQQTVKDINDSSIVFKLTYQDTSILFMADAEIPLEQQLLTANADLSAQILKVGHHGSKNATSQEFLQVVQPKLAIISVAKQNQFNQPSFRVVKRLEQSGAKVLQTSSGTIFIFLKKEGGYTFDIL